MGEILPDAGGAAKLIAGVSAIAAAASKSMVRFMTISLVGARRFGLRPRASVLPCLAFVPAPVTFDAGAGCEAAAGHCGMKSQSAGVPSSEEGDIMTYYRLYFLEGPNCTISDFKEFEVAGDAAAIAAADRLRGMGAMELWCGGRKVRGWEPLGAVPAHRLPARLANLPAPSRMSPSGVRSGGRLM